MSVLVIVVSTPVCQRCSARKHPCLSMQRFPSVMREEVDHARYDCVRVQATVDEKSECNIHDSAQANQEQKEVALALVSQNLIISNMSRGCLSFCLAVPRFVHGSLIVFFDASE